LKINELAPNIIYRPIQDTTTSYSLRYALP
jgi:hypothetical protein